MKPMLAIIIFCCEIFLHDSSEKGIFIPLNGGDVVLSSVTVTKSGQYDFSYGGGVMGKAGGVLDVLLRVNTIPAESFNFSGITEINNQTMQIATGGMIQLRRDDIVDVAVNHHGAGEDTTSTNSKLQLRLHQVSK